MVSVPLSWKLEVHGANEVKSVMNDIQRAFERGQISLDDRNHSMSQLNRTAIQSNNIGRYQNNIYLAQHPLLLKTSRALSTVTSITRTLLTVSNALNLSRIHGSIVTARDIEDQNQLNELTRTILRLEREGKTDTDEYRLAVEDKNVALAENKERLQAIADQKFDSLVTSVESAIFTVATTFSLLVKNETILNALRIAGKFFGGVFAGFFELVSNASIKLMSWLSPSITSPANTASVTTAGRTLGGVFGTAFVVGTAIAIAAASVLLIDIIQEALGDGSKLKELTGTSGAEALEGMTGVKIFENPPTTEAKIFDVKPFRETFNDLENPLIKFIHGVLDPIQEFVDNLVNMVLPSAYGDGLTGLGAGILELYEINKRLVESSDELKTSFDNSLFSWDENTSGLNDNNLLIKGLSQDMIDGSIGFTDLGGDINELRERIMILDGHFINNTIVSEEGNRIIKEYTEFARSDSTARERMREETMKNTQALFDMNAALGVTQNAMELAARTAAQAIADAQNSPISNGGSESGQPPPGPDEGSVITGGLHTGFDGPAPLLDVNALKISDYLISCNAKNINALQNIWYTANQSILDIKKELSRSEYKKATPESQILEQGAWNVMNTLESQIKKLVNMMLAIGITDPNIQSIYSPIKAAHGYDGMINHPTLFLAGESGPEHISITPNGRSYGGNTTIVNIGGSVITERQLFARLDEIQKNNLRRRGFVG